MTLNSETKTRRFWRWSISSTALVALSISGCAKKTETPKATEPAPTKKSQQIQESLSQFSKDSKSFMAKLPPKFDRNGNLVKESSRFFSREQIESREFVASKDKNRAGDDFHPGQQLILKDGSTGTLTELDAAKSLPGRVSFEENDDARNLAELGSSRFVSSIKAMEELKLLSATLERETLPWSDDYWAIYKGQLAARYADGEFPASQEWQENKNYFDTHKITIEDIIRRPSFSSIELLSPAEKYDLLTGDPAQTFTEYQWSQGEQYVRKYGKVETWMGVCHGWAPAAYMLPRPERAIEVLAADGKTKIPFYPADIKALSTQLWATANTGSLFIGGRCNEKNPEADASGRTKDQDCFDNNPGSWHQAIVNRIGRGDIDTQTGKVIKRSFVLDATYDYEVWNQPVVGYTYSYFNPVAMKVASTREGATVPKLFQGDKFLEWRKKGRFWAQVDSIVGIVMDVTYVVETRPTASPTDSPERDAHRTARYIYDLELDRDGNILGGEWYQNTHPDFLWTPPKGTRASSSADRRVFSAWDGSTALPADWKSSAVSAARTGTPLAKIVDALIVLSKTTR